MFDLNFIIFIVIIIDVSCLLNSHSFKLANAHFMCDLLFFFFFWNEYIRNPITAMTFLWFYFSLVFFFFCECIFPSFNSISIAFLLQYFVMGFIFIYNLQSLFELELAGCNEVTEAGLWSCLTPRIVSLSLADCINIADEAVGAVAQLLPSLYEFSLQVSDSKFNEMIPVLNLFCTVISP